MRGAILSQECPMQVSWKIGVEIELLAPPQSSRADLAQAYADDHRGSVRRILHQDSEPSRVPGHPIFHNMTLGFEALDQQGRLIASCVDDLTLQDDLHRQAKPKPGWWRIVCDDERLLRLLSRHVDPELDLPDALAELAPLCGGQLLSAPGGLYRLIDAVGAPLIIAAPLPGERERPCEIITPPIESDHAARLEYLLGVARRLRFSVPVEGATHIHFDAGPLCHAGTIANLVNLLQAWGGRLRRLCGTPSSFRRVGGWPDALLECINSADFRALPWTEAQARLRALEPSKFCDFNLKNIAHARLDRHTFEVRILPACTEAMPVLAAAVLFQGILVRCGQTPEIHAEDPAPWHADGIREFLDTLALDADAHLYWRQRVADVDALANDAGAQDSAGRS
jgi:hypothetical protein